MADKLDNISYGKPSAGQIPLKAYQSSNSAKVRNDTKTTKSKLRRLAKKWKGVNSVYGFLTELWIALGVNNQSENPSKYAAFNIGNGVIVTIRASSHNANAQNYLKEGNTSGDSNISIVLQKKWRRNRFKANDNVELKEYVYIDSRIANVENPLSKIALSLVGYLTNGRYVETTGVAIQHQSPPRQSPERDVQVEPTCRSAPWK